MSGFQFNPLFHTKVQSYNSHLTCQEYKVVTGSVSCAVPSCGEGAESWCAPQSSASVGGGEVRPGLNQGEGIGRS